MITKEEVRRVLAMALVHDDRGRFNSWRADEAWEWADMVAEAIVSMSGIRLCPDCGGELQLLERCVSCGHMAAAK